MNDTFVVRTLMPERIREAYPIVSLFNPAVTAKSWNDYARSLADLPGAGRLWGILTVQSPQSHILGLSVYRVQPDLGRGRVLAIENFAVANLVGMRIAAAALLEALEEVARERECDCMVLTLLDPRLRRLLRKTNGTASDFFKGAGFQGERLRLRKCFEHPEATCDSDGPSSA